MKSIFNKISTDFNQGVQYSKKYRILIFFSILLTFFVVVLVHNLHLFTTIIFEDGDYAANSILINLAKSFQLLVGHYSRMGFNHPGPAFLYVMAFFEKIFFDGLHIVPSAFNAQEIGIMFLNSFFLAICCYIFFDMTKSVIKTLSVVALVLFFYSINPILLYSTWMAHVFFAPFFAFILSASVVSAKRSSFIWVMILSGMFLIHGHVTFFLIICPVFPISLILCLFKYKFDFNKFLQDNRFNIHLSVIIIIVFLTPIFLNTIINYPGEFGKYFQYSSNSVRVIPDIYSIIGFFLPFWSIVVTSMQFPSKLPIIMSDKLAGLFSLFFMSGAIVIIYKYTSEKKIREIILSTSIIIFTVSILFLLYIAKGIDDLSALNHYTGIFFYAVPLLLLCLILLGVISKISNYKIITIILLISLITIGITASMGDFTNPYNGSSDYKEIVTKLQSDPRWNTDTIILDFSRDYWSEVAGIVITSKRLGKSIFLSDPFWKVLFTKNYIFKLDNKNVNKSNKIWHIRLTDKLETNQKVILSNKKFSIIDDLNSTIGTGNG